MRSCRKTKSLVNRRVTFLILFIFSLSTLACNLSTFQLGEGSYSPIGGWVFATASPQVVDPLATVQETLQPTLEITATPAPPIIYTSLAGDTLPALVARFGVSPDQINSSTPLPTEGLIPPGIIMIIDNVLGETADSRQVLPDSEVIFSPSTVNFDITTFVDEAGGYLSSYSEYTSTGTHTGAEIVMQVAQDNSINPRLLLALLEYQGHWVYGQPTNIAEADYPLGRIDINFKGLYKQLNWAAKNLANGYYGWRSGSITSLIFPDGSSLRIAPTLNAGSVALQTFLAQLFNQREWAGALYDEDGCSALLETMFGSPWQRAQEVEPLLPAGISQPELQLPFQPGYLWSFSGGPHAAWSADSSLAALDFAPASTEPGCVKSEMFVTASAPGLIIRTGTGLIIEDLDGDGYEQTGWVLLYLHVAHDDRFPIQVGDWVDQDAVLGHPSCEGGVATGSHVHIARKYNGEWVLADGPLPFVLSGYTAHAGDKPYQGTLTKDDQVITANTNGSAQTNIRRTE